MASPLGRFQSGIATVFALLLCSVPAAAQPISLAWDPNTETDLAGYIVEYGPAATPFTQSVDVGKVTTWTYGTPALGVSYSFHVIAYNTAGERSAPSDPVTSTPSGPTLTPDRTSFIFGIVSSTAKPRTHAQTIRLLQSGAGTITWTATSGAPWLQVSPTSGTGSAAVTLTLVPSAAPASSTSTTVSFALSGAANTIAPIPVTLTVIAPTATRPAYGFLDTPPDNSMGITGSMALTGWALDDVDVVRVRILRDPVAGEGTALIYVGDATLIDDARPDVAGIYTTAPANYRGGWGYLALTNMLPSLGNGTFRFYAYADDADGHTTLLGTKTVTCDNAHGVKPFGTIDSPGPGDTISGTAYANYGWVLSPGTARADVPGGGTVSVLIDGVGVGTPVGWSARPDLTSLFPVTQYAGVGSALAIFGIDTTTLTNGMHTIAWVVTDNTGQAQGVGSRFFRVFNPGGLMAPSTGAAAAGSQAPTLDAEVTAASVDMTPIEARRGFALDAALRSYVPDAGGRIVLQSEELDRIELKTNGATEGYLRVGADLRPLPVGSRLDATTGTFVWGTSAGFVGPYDLVFVRRSGGRLSRQDVRVVLNPKNSNRIGPQLIVDRAGRIVTGWAADLDSPSDTGIATIHVWAYPRGGQSQRFDPSRAIFVGAASYGGARPDVAAAFGDQFRNSGYGIVVDGLAPGTYDIALFAWSTARHTFLPATVVTVDIK